MAGTQGFEPDTQIQSPLECESAQHNQVSTAAANGEVRQKAQHSRNTMSFDDRAEETEEDTLP